MFEVMYSLPLEIIIILVITLIYFTICSYEDFRKKEVLNYINYSYALIILFMSLILTLYLNDISYIIQASFGMVVGFLLGSIFFFIGMWGGGDAKFMIGFGGSFALLQQHLSSYISSLFQQVSISQVVFSWSYIIFLVLLIISIFLSMISIGVVLYSILFKHKKSKQYVKSAILTIILFTIQLFAILSTVIASESMIILIVSIFMMLISLILFLMLPQDAIIHFSRTFSISIKQLKERIENNEQLVLLEDIVYKKNLVVSMKESLYGISNYHIQELKKYYSNSHAIQVCKPINEVMLIPLFNFLIYVFSVILLFNSINAGILFITLFEFMLLSFTIGGIYVFLIILFHSVFNFKICMQQISFVHKTSIFTLLVIGIIGFFLFDGLIKYYSGMMIIIGIAYALYLLSKIVEKSLFVINVDTQKLSPGDWIVEDIIINDKILYKKEEFSLGANEEQLEVIKKNKHLKTVKVKTGIAFIPHLFVAFLILLLI